tara:strand:+ start:232 stop:687 length:456 start_codon:yes stop_codon:yes gene_type:complete
MREFRCDCVLNKELYIGRAPINIKHLEILENQGIKSILSLCGEEEARIIFDKEKIFRHSRIVLNDHKTGKLPDIDDLILATEEINKLKKFGPVYVHCKMAIERSPLVCMAYLMRFHKISFDNALNYLMQVHKETNPLAEQLNLLMKINLLS